MGNGRGRYNQRARDVYERARSGMPKRKAKEIAAGYYEPSEELVLSANDAEQHPVLRMFLPLKYGFETGYLGHKEERALMAALAEEYSFPQELITPELVRNELEIPSLNSLFRKPNKAAFLELCSPFKTIQGKGIRCLFATHKELMKPIRNVIDLYIDYAKKLQAEAIFGSEKEAEVALSSGKYVVPELSFKEALLAGDLEPFNFEYSRGRYRRGNIEVGYDSGVLATIWVGDSPIEDIEELNIPEEENECDYLAGRITNEAVSYLEGLLA